MGRSALLWVFVQREERGIFRKRQVSKAELGKFGWNDSCTSGIQNDPVLFHGSKELSKWSECIDRDSVILFVSVEMVSQSFCVGISQGFSLTGASV